MTTIKWETMAREVLDLTDAEESARTRVLRASVPKVAQALQQAFEEGKKEAEGRMRDLLDGKIPAISHLGPIG